jgi:hypothetical protein
MFGLLRSQAEDHSDQQALIGTKIRGPFSGSAIQFLRSVLIAIKEGTMIKSLSIKSLTVIFCQITICLVLIIYCTMPASAETDNNSQLIAARQTVESFCKAEFEGDDFDLRVKLIKFSSSRKKIEEKRTGPASPWVYFWDWDPFYIISSYKILNVELRENRGMATIAYNRVGESKGKERIIPSKKEQDIVKLDLIYDGKQWWIFDPPLPRISINVLTRIYEKSLQICFDENWLKRASAEQRKTCIQTQEALKTLKGL